MTLKDLIKTTEGIVVLGGLSLTFIFGEMFAILTAAVYILLNVPNLWNKLKTWYSSFKK
jgi:hypothetical protein